MENPEKLRNMISIVIPAISAIAGAFFLWAVGTNIVMDVTGRVIFLIGGAFLGAGFGSLIDSTFHPQITNAISRSVHRILILLLAVISAVTSYILILGASSGNHALSIFGAYAAFFIPVIALGYLIDIVKNLRE
jgi:hypothetical protein